jgi:transposase
VVVEPPVNGPGETGGTTILPVSDNNEQSAKPMQGKGLRVSNVDGSVVVEPPGNVPGESGETPILPASDNNALRVNPTQGNGSRTSKVDGSVVVEPPGNGSDESGETPILPASDNNARRVKPTQDNGSRVSNVDGSVVVEPPGSGSDENDETPILSASDNNERSGKPKRGNVSRESNVDGSVAVEPHEDRCVETGGALILTDSDNNKRSGKPTQSNESPDSNVDSRVDVDIPGCGTKAMMSPPSLPVDGDNERSRKRSKGDELLGFIKKVEEDELPLAGAAKLTGYSTRQFQRIINNYRKSGELLLKHQGTGKPSNHRISDEVRQRIEECLISWPPGGGPTVINEILREQEGIFIATETLRKIMIEKNLWVEGVRKQLHRRTRERRASFGELTQMDTSEHPWFGEGCDKSYLIAMIDDATGTVYARFYDADSTITNMDCLKRYFLLNGRPLSLYVDMASHFRVNEPEGKGGLIRPETQIERACRELDIEIIHAHSPEAKGRVERLFRTLQDRLVYRLRFNQIESIEAANKFLDDSFLDKYNGRYAKPAASALNYHRPVDGLNLDGVLSVQDLRVVNKDNTFKYAGRKYQLHPRSDTPNLVRRKIVVENRINGTMRVNFGGVYINFSLLK